MKELDDNARVSDKALPKFKINDLKFCQGIAKNDNRLVCTYVKDNNLCFSTETIELK
jgi:hypothetical protein